MNTELQVSYLGTKTRVALVRAFMVLVSNKGRRGDENFSCESEGKIKEEKPKKVNDNVARQEPVKCRLRY